MKVYFVRHWETTWDLENRYGWTYDDHLTPTWEKQSHECSQKLLDKEISIVLHSPKKRAHKTAEIIWSNLAVSCEIIDDLKERNNYWILSWLTKQEAEQKYPNEVAKLRKCKTHHDVEWSESYEDFKERVFSTIDEILKKKIKDDILVVSHGWFISTFIREKLWINKMKLSDCCIIELEYLDWNFKLLSMDGASIINE